MLFPSCVLTSADDGGFREVARLIEKYQPSRLPEPAKAELTRLMESEARRYGMDALPPRE